ncbi:MAG: Ig-like domain-containing protein [Armatimonadetes bacterium]|nr:Ig-like domain-containing protein [Armatimonadota bacterium]MDW8120912.1 hypothetical protein [Armatimonadota bacterium]
MILGGRTGPARLRHRWLPLAVVGALSYGLLVMTGCAGEAGVLLGPGPGPGPGVSLSQFLDAFGRAVTDTDNNGVPDLPEESRPTVFTAFRGFNPRQIVEVMLYFRNNPVLEGPLQLTADRNGNIPLLPFWDIGVGGDGRPVSAQGRYDIVASGEGRQTTVTFDIRPGRSFSLLDRSRQVRFSTIVVLAGSIEEPVWPRGSIWEGAPVLVQGWGFPPNRSIRLYVIRDVSPENVEATLRDVSGGFETETTRADGTFGPVVVWSSARRLGDRQQDGDFDVVADVDSDGAFTYGDAINIYVGAGFTVQRAPVTPWLAQLAAKKYGEFSDTFEVTDDVGVWVNPPTRPLTPFQRVRKYVVLHQAEWREGDVLVDVTGRPETDLMRFACANQFYLPVWVGPLRPGKYDVVVDLNLNGRYDPSVDILDDGRAPGSDPAVGAGFRVAGTPPPSSIALSIAPPAINDGDSADAFAQVVTADGRPRQGIRVGFRVASGEASLSSNEAITNARGIAQVRVTPTRRNQTIVLQAQFTEDGETRSAEAFLRVRDFGELQAVFRKPLSQPR